MSSFSDQLLESHLAQQKLKIEASQMEAVSGGNANVGVVGSTSSRSCVVGPIPWLEILVGNNTLVDSGSQSNNIK